MNGTLVVHIEPGLDGAAHMRRDGELLRSQARDAPPVLRLYTWSPPAVSFGHMQRAADLLDLEACRAAGVDVVQRPTGGRAVLHWEEITYAVVAGTADARFGTTLRAAHATIGACLAAGLAALGVAATLSRPRLDPERRMLRQPCFASPGRAELLVGGRKLLGSAQRRTPRAFLQHGSLLVGPAHLRLVDLLADARRDPEARAAMRARLAGETVTLREILGREPDFEELASAVEGGFRAVLDGRHEGAS
jgi:lipoate-protein ligase A